jgi:aryl-alcohol dehydrogenase-like predicted oxidoreductase
MGIDAAGTVQLGSHTVHRLGFGAMRICGPDIWGPPADPAEARRVLRRVLELGLDLVDTADSYGPAISEELIAEAWWPYPKGLLVATKGGLHRKRADDWSRDARPAHLKSAVAGSLRRLKVDRITLYQLHAPDPNVPFEDSVGAIAEERAAGRIEHVGLSNVNVEQLAQARAIVPIVSVQNRYNLVDRTSEKVLRYCTEHGITFLPWRPLALGTFGAPGGSVARIADRHGATPSQVALAWLLARSPVMAPIPGTGRVDHLEENCAAADLALTDADVALLDRAGRAG